MEVIQRAQYLSTSLNVHIKLDTGMHRLGFVPAEWSELCSVLAVSDKLNVVSVFTHLAAADDPEKDEFTNHQIQVFQKGYDRISRAIGKNPIRHVLNSAGIERMPNYAMDMVRLGIGLHGIGSTIKASAQLTPVNTFKTVISQVKKVSEGESVGYSGKNKVERDTEIAVVPVGYADGYPRYLGNGKGKMLVNGKLAPIVGNVCMDMVMIDVTGLNAREGDEVFVFGRHLPIQEVALWANTITYELLAGVSSRVKRVYVQGL
jgi:alanine racemase